jgi:hypothetical protein
VLDRYGGETVITLRAIFKSILSTGAVAATIATAGTTPGAQAQSQSGFPYNGINLTSYQATEYQNSASAASTLRATGANYGAVMVTQYQPTSTSTTIAPETTSSPGYNSSYSLSPTDAAVVTAIKNLQAQGLVVSLKPQVDSLDGVFRGNFAPSNPSAWFASYQTFILHYAQIAAQNNVGMLVIGTELKSLTTSTYKSNWETIITALRTQYPGLTLAYGANATGAGDEFTSVSFWADVDVIGVDGYFPLTNQNDPPLSALVAAWSNNKSGFNIVAALKNLQSTYNKPLIFTEIGYVSVSGTNKIPYANINGTYDQQEQQDCYEAFFEVFSAQSAWMKGVFWWDWTVSPPSSTDTGYTPQNKSAGNVTLPKWFNSTTAGFTLAPASSTVALGQGLTTTNVISVSNQGSFNGAVTLAATGLPAGVTGAFSAGTGTNTQNLTLTASSTAAVAGPVTVTVTGTSGAITASTTFALTVVTPIVQTISFTNPGAQKIGATVGLVASVPSNLPITFASTTPTVCTVASGSATATTLLAGTCTITAAQSGSATYAAATTVSQSFAVSAIPAIAVPANADILVSQINYRALVNGYALSAGNPAGGSFGINSLGMAALGNNINIQLIDTNSGAIINLGADSNAAAVAVDPNNNIYIGNSYGPVNSIAKLPYVGGSANGGYANFSTPTATTPVCTTGGTSECLLPANLGSINVSTMTFDAAGNLFFATAGSGNTSGNSIYECNLTCIGGTGAPVLLYTEPTANPAPSATSGQALVGSLAIDSAGNLFFTDSIIYTNLTSYAYSSFSSNVKELPTSTGAGFGGVATGYAAAPSTIYTLNTPSPSSYGNQINGVVVQRSGNGDTVYFADQYDGVFGFPDSPGGIPVVAGKPTSLFTAGKQGAKNLGIDAKGNLYPVGYSSALGSGGETLAQITLNAVTVPNSPTGTAVSPSTTTSPISTILNDTTCSGPPPPSVTFSPVANSSATATVTASTSCSSTFTGSASYPTTVSFNPTTAGPDSVTVTDSDQSSNSGSFTISGTGAGFSLAPAATPITVFQSANVTDNILVTSFGGFTGNVTLAATGLPTGVTASFATNPTTAASVLTFTANATAPAGTSIVTVTGTSGATTATTTIGLNVTATPTYTIAPSAATLAVTQGTSGTDTITITAGTGFSSSVAFTASGLPTGVTAAFSPNPTTTGSAVLTLTASGTAAVGGPVTVTVTGTVGTATQTTTIALTVNQAPGFTLAAAPAAVTVGQGSTNTSTVTVTPVAGFTGSVTLAATGLPAGVTAAFGTNPTTGTSVVTFTATATATTGPATVTITGTSGSVTATATISLTVAPPPTFALAATPAALSIVQGNTGTSTVTVTGTNGFNGGVTLAATGLPTGVTAVFTTNPTTTSTVVTFTVTATAPAGTANVTITGTAGTLTSSTTVAITTVLAPTFTLTPSATSLAIVQGATATDTITIAPANGFTGMVTLAASGLPGGVTAAFSANPATAASTLTLTATAAAILGGPVQVTVTGTSGTIVITTTVSLTVNPPPGFSLTVTPAMVTLAQTTSVTSTVSVSSVGGFTGTPVLTVTGLPAGVTASFAAGTAGTQILTLTASATAVASVPPAPVTLTITGTSGTLKSATTIALTVIPAPSFTFTAPDLVVKHGAGVLNTTPISIVATNGFSGTVSLTCAVTPAVSNPPTCTLNPTSVTLAGTTAQVSTLTIGTTGGSLAQNGHAPSFWTAGGGAALACVLMAFLPRRRRNWAAGLLVLALGAVFLGLAGCGSTPTYNTASTGTPVGTYAVTITGTSGSTTAAGTVNLTVQ